MKSVVKMVGVIMGATFICPIAFVIIYVIVMVSAIGGMPAWAQPKMAKWILNIPVNSDYHGRPSGPTCTQAGEVGWGGYNGPDQNVLDLPIWDDDIGRLPYINCLFMDPDYPIHNGIDWPEPEGTPIRSVNGGKVVWTGVLGVYGNLVVVENGDYQFWYAHLREVNVFEGQTVDFGDVLGLSGGLKGAWYSGNSTGPHLHYHIKHRISEDVYECVDPMKLNPELYIEGETYTKVVCSSD
jgi:hypothetical protein